MNATFSIFFICIENGSFLTLYEFKLRKTTIISHFGYERTLLSFRFFTYDLLAGKKSSSWNGPGPGSIPAAWVQPIGSSYSSSLFDNLSSF